MSNPLTAGAIKEIFLDHSNLPKSPVLQVLGLKKVQGNQGGSERYRMILSDGIHLHTCAMLATQLNDMVVDNQLDTKAVIRLDKYICNIIHETRKVLIILELSIIKKGSECPRYGDPKQYVENTDEKSSTGTTQNNNKPSVQQNPNPGSANVKRNQAPPSGSRFASHQTPVSRTQTGPTVFPISSLNPYNNKWTICARVTSKSSIREWSNSKGQGRLFSVDLIDESGEIRATCFTELVDRFYPLLEQNKIYYISKGSMRPANKRFCSLKNDYELTFNNDTTVELCQENNSIPTLQFNFVEIAKIQDVQPENLIDIVAVCSNIAEVKEVNTRAGKQVSKRDLTLMDSTASVTCTLWGKEAENFEKYVGSNPIIAMKGVKVSDFGGRTLSTLPSSTMMIDPDTIEEAFKLRGWYDNVGHSESIGSISGQRGDGMSTSVYKTISDIKKEGLGTSEKPDYFNLVATVSYFKKDNCLYKACPKQDCNKKVIEDADHYRCEKCNQTYPNFKHRLLLKINVADYTGEQWLTCFQDTAEQLLGRTADEIGTLRDTDEKAFEQVFSKNAFIKKLFRVKAKVDTYNDETRVNCSADRVASLDLRKEARRLAEEIEKLMVSNGQV
ncbi:replication protein A 70 kDa DNA-binding subunit-like [Dendronephthya gigantea]|uniref:replication protein A 70 kDa DNA-binding subunit-like n=1 Tax=Dendronephthya gigantea TaxID=151771 RepID=UPI001069B22E|nr:replication protein A 70 kDa DNA-binding subunit-like [Dendronephthya gigantea]